MSVNKNSSAESFQRRLRIDSDVGKVCRAVRDRQACRIVEQPASESSEDDANGGEEERLPEREGLANALVGDSGREWADDVAEAEEVTVSGGDTESAPCSAAAKGMELKRWHNCTLTQKAFLRVLLLTPKKVIETELLLFLNP